MQLLIIRYPRLWRDHPLSGAAPRKSEADGMYLFLESAECVT